MLRLNFQCHDVGDEEARFVITMRHGRDSIGNASTFCVCCERALKDYESAPTHLRTVHRGVVDLAFLRKKDGKEVRCQPFESKQHGKARRSPASVSDTVW